MSIRNVLSLLIAGIACFAAHDATGQDLVVDSAHIANQFSQVRSLGGMVDRIETKAADHALEQSMLNEILGAGWQVISYRQNTEIEHAPRRSGRASPISRHGIQFFQTSSAKYTPPCPHPARETYHLPPAV